MEGGRGDWGLYKQSKSHNTGSYWTFPTPCEKVGYLLSPANQYREDAGDRAHSLLYLCQKTRMYNHLRMS